MAGPQTLAAMHAVIDDNTSANITPADVRLVSEGLYSIDQDETPVVDGDYAWLNQGSATKDVNSRGMILLQTGPESSDYEIRARVKTAPSEPYLIAVRLDVEMPQDSEMLVGLLFRDSVSGNIATYAFDTQDSLPNHLYVHHWTDEHAVAGEAANRVYPWCPKWLQIGLSGETLSFRYGADGENWIDFYSDAADSLMSLDPDEIPNQVGFFIANNNLGGGSQGDVQLLIRSWKES